MNVEARLKELALVLPPAPRPSGNYLPAVQIGELLFTSGMLPLREGQLAFEGKLGGELTLEEGREAARLALLNALAVVRHELDGLDRITRFVRLTGYVSSSSGFTQQPAVLDGASDLLVAIFGNIGRHSRVALGAVELPLNSPIELELILQFHP